jgi:tyrosyl-tRNA synthetase
MQAYDSVQVKADIELGGTDQLFNLLAGRELMEKLDMQPQVCLTLPLLEGTDGKLKMSKSYGNYIGITDAPDQMFGKVMSIPDELMERYFYLASSYSVPEVEQIMADVASDKLHPNLAKRQLAANIVAVYHGPEAAEQAEQDFDRIYKNKEMPTEIPEVALEILPGDDGQVYIPQVLIDLGFASSAGEARRLIDNGGVKLNSEALATKQYKVDPSKIAGAVVAVGKRKYAKLV